MPELLKFTYYVPEFSLLNRDFNFKYILHHKNTIIEHYY